MSHARRFLGLSLDVLCGTFDCNRPYRGARLVEQAITASTDLSDSVLESLALVRIRDLGFAEPVQQWEVRVGSDRYRVDFAWEHGAIVLEVDGRAKYENATMLEGRSGAQVVWEEKRREDAIRASAERFARAGWTDAWDGVGLERRLLAAGVPRVRPPRPLTR